MNKEKVLSADSPYVELFGVDGMGRGRPALGSVAHSLAHSTKVQDDPRIENSHVANQIRGQARIRANTVMRFIRAAEYRKILQKEVQHLSDKWVIENLEEDASSSDRSA